MPVVLTSLIPCHKNEVFINFYAVTMGRQRIAKNVIVALRVIFRIRAFYLVTVKKYGVVSHYRLSIQANGSTGTNTDQK